MIIFILPIALLVSYSQLIVKWRASMLNLPNADTSTLIDRLFVYVSDPFIFSGYFSALLGSFLWMFVIAKIPLSTGFPIYIGMTFLLVLLGSFFILDETVNLKSFFSILLILLGIYLGVKA